VNPTNSSVKQREGNLLRLVGLLTEQNRNRRSASSNVRYKANELYLKLAGVGQSAANVRQNNKCKRRKDKNTINLKGW